MKITLAFLAALLSVAGAVEAAPIAFEEVSLLVRVGEPTEFITRQVAERHLLRALTPGQEARLKAAGATEGLLQALRNPATVLPPEEAAAFETWSAGQREALEKRIAAQAAEEKAERMARAAALAAWQQEQAARERVMAEAGATAATSYANTYAPYRGYYGIPYVPTTPCIPHQQGGHASSGSLRWSNGTATTYTGAGLSYHPLGTNGAGVQNGQCAPGIDGARKDGVRWRGR